jgi:tetratricopeptide (TPR) repeat protein
MKAPVTALIALLVLASCQTAPAPLAPDASPEIYFQRAQNASDQGQYDEALSIYRAFLANRPDASPESVFSARYEIALLLLKKGLKDEAQTDFEGIVADYDNLDKSAGAPGWVKVLSLKKLQEMKEKAPKAPKAQ